MKRREKYHSSLPIHTLKKIVNHPERNPFSSLPSGDEALKMILDREDSLEIAIWLTENWEEYSFSRERVFAYVLNHSKTPSILEAIQKLLFDSEADEGSRIKLLSAIEKNHQSIISYEDLKLLLLDKKRGWLADQAAVMMMSHFSDEHYCRELVMARVSHQEVSEMENWHLGSVNRARYLYVKNWPDLQTEQFLAQQIGDTEDPVKIQCLLDCYSVLKPNERRLAFIHCVINQYHTNEAVLLSLKTLIQSYDSDQKLYDLAEDLAQNAKEFSLQRSMVHFCARHPLAKLQYNKILYRLAVKKDNTKAIMEAEKYSGQQSVQVSAIEAIHYRGELDLFYETSQILSDKKDCPDYILSIIGKLCVALAVTEARFFTLFKIVFSHDKLLNSVVIIKKMSKLWKEFDDGLEYVCDLFKQAYKGKPAPIECEYFDMKLIFIAHYFEGYPKLNKWYIRFMKKGENLTQSAITKNLINNNIPKLKKYIQKWFHHDEYSVRQTVIYSLPLVTDLLSAVEMHDLLTDYYDEDELASLTILARLFPTKQTFDLIAKRINEGDKEPKDDEPVDRICSQLLGELTLCFPNHPKLETLSVKEPD